MNRTYLNSEFKKLLKTNGFPDLHVHDLRHANASLLINMGVPVKVISEHLGHSNTLTTENIYAHIFKRSFYVFGMIQKIPNMKKCVNGEKASIIDHLILHLEITSSRLA